MCPLKISCLLPRYQIQIIHALTIYLEKRVKLLKTCSVFSNYFITNVYDSEFDLTYSMKISVNSAYVQCFSTEYQNQTFHDHRVVYNISVDKLFY